MRGLLLLPLLCAVPVCAQRGGFGGRAPGTFQPATPRINSIPPRVGAWGNSFGRQGFGHGFGGYNAARYGHAGYGYFAPAWGYPTAGGYDFAYPDESLYDGPSNTIIVQAQPQAPPPPPERARGEIREYTWKGVSVVPERKFVVALNDGSKRYPVATFITGGALHCINSEGRQEVIQATLIDRATTERLNRENGLKLQLPPG